MGQMQRDWKDTIEIVTLNKRHTIVAKMYSSG
jgi:hypothetical protein